jgi:hypothetical protein
MVAFVLPLMTLGMLSCGGDDADPQAAATDLADTWARGWNENDPELVGAVFTEDATYSDDVGFFEGRLRTKQEHVADVRERGALITETQRATELTSTDDDTFRFDMEFTAHGDRYWGTIEIEVEGDLISRFEWMALEVIGS